MARSAQAADSHGQFFFPDCDMRVKTQKMEAMEANVRRLVATSSTRTPEAFIRTHGHAHMRWTPIKKHLNTHIVMREYEEKSHIIFGLAINTVRVHIHRSSLGG